MSNLLFECKTYNSLNKKELYALLHLRSKVFVLEQDCAYLDMDYKDQKALHLLGYIGNELVAYARLFSAGDYFKFTSIGRVVVSHQHRGKTYGKKLMQEAIKVCKEKLNRPIKISAQCYLEKFYTDLGFERKGESYLEDGIPHIKMALSK